MRKRFLNLQLFGEGGDGGGGATGGEAAGEAAVDTGEDVPAHIPERAREMYRKAVSKNKPTPKASEPTTTEAPVEEPKKLSYADLIKSDDYKEEHKAYMDKTIKDRFKKYEGLEASNKKMAEALNVVANKYNLDVASETFMDDLTAKIAADNSYYEEYAMQHDISLDEAKEILDLKQQMSIQKANEAQRQAAEAELQKQEENQRRFANLQVNAEKTKQLYPSFNLEAELQNEQFARMCAVLNDNTTAAYRAVHHEELAQAQSVAIAKQASQQAANAIAANKSRPIENGLSSQATTVTTTDWSKASLADIRKYAEEQRRLKR